MKRILIFVIFGLLLPIAALALTPSQLWRADGQVNIAGKWLFLVGARKIPYRVFLTQHKISSDTYAIGGYMLDPKGKRFPFHHGSLMHGNGSNTVFILELYEGESIWRCVLEKGPGYWWSGDVHHVHTGRFQAIFRATRL